MPSLAVIGFFKQKKERPYLHKGRLCFVLHVRCNQPANHWEDAYQFFSRLIGDPGFFPNGSSSLIINYIDNQFS